jgi:hypothetical protein
METAGVSDGITHNFVGWPERQEARQGFGNEDPAWPFVVSEIVILLSLREVTAIDCQGIKLTRLPMKTA